MYKLVNLYGKLACITRLEDGAGIPINIDNTDYQAFRTSILDGLAQLENADGVLLTSQEAIAFVETLGEA